MKLVSLEFKNVGMIADASIKVDKPLIIFYGEVRQGKSTILNGIRWCFGGSFPQDIIRHGAEEASVKMVLHPAGSISRSWYKSTSGETKARSVTFIRDGEPVRKPADEIAKLLNPFLLDQDHLRNMGEADRKAFFRDLFAVDTTELDAEAAKCEQSAKDLRAEIKGYGDIDLTEVKPVDVGALRLRLYDIRAMQDQKRQQWNADCERIRNEHEDACESIRAKHQEESVKVNQANHKATQRASYRKSIEDRIGEITEEITTLQSKLEVCRKTLEDNPELPTTTTPAPMVLPDAPKLPDAPLPVNTSEIETAIQDGAAQNVRFERYLDNKFRAAGRDAKRKALATIEAREKAIKTEKTAKLKDISSSCGVPDLAFDEAGNFTFEGVSAGMLSTSQVMRLSSALSALYPPGFGIDLLDRGESLGKSIFTLIDRAKREEKTILATVVGEAPAEVPDNVGVFVVENGNVKGAK
jgi:DNA repair exonuclease SbcCD ATPase subunit